MLLSLKKRGLPHSPNLLILADDDRLCIADDVDKVVCVELTPDPNSFPDESEKDQEKRLYCRRWFTGLGDQSTLTHLVWGIVIEIVVVRIESLRVSGGNGDDRQPKRVPSCLDEVDHLPVSCPFYVFSVPAESLFRNRISL